MLLGWVKVPFSAGLEERREANFQKKKNGLEISKKIALPPFKIQ
jgi:hypothetical protein